MVSFKTIEHILVEWFALKPNCSLLDNSLSQYRSRIILSNILPMRELRAIPWKFVLSDIFALWPLGIEIPHVEVCLLRCIVLTNKCVLVMFTTSNWIDWTKNVCWFEPLLIFLWDGQITIFQGCLLGNILCLFIINSDDLLNNCWILWSCRVH